MQIEQLIESLRLEETKDHVIVYDLEAHISRLFASITELSFYHPEPLRASGSHYKTKGNPDVAQALLKMTDFILLMQTQIKAKAQYQFNKGVAFFDSRFNIDRDSISLRQRSSSSKIHKLRLLYSRDGTFSIEIEEYLRDLNKDWRVKIFKPEEFQIDSQDPKWKHKFYPRQELSLRALAKQSSANLDEVIWTNEKNQICEGSFTNIFFQDQEGQWHTPHLDCNILPGIMRAKLIEELNAKEGFYTELPAKILLVNSLFCKFTYNLRAVAGVQEQGI